MFNTRLCINEIIELLRANVQAFLPADIPVPTSIEFGLVPMASESWQSPSMFVYLSSVQPELTEQCVWESEMVLTITTAIASSDITVNDCYALCYIDAVQNIFITHSETEHVWNFVLGFGEIDNETVSGAKLATVTVTCTLRAGQ